MHKITLCVRSISWWCHVCNKLGKEWIQYPLIFEGLGTLKNKITKMLYLWHPQSLHTLKMYYELLMLCIYKTLLLPLSLSLFGWMSLICLLYYYVITCYGCIGAKWHRKNGLPYFKTVEDSPVSQVLAGLLFLKVKNIIHFTKASHKQRCTC